MANNAYCVNLITMNSGVIQENLLVVHYDKEELKTYANTWFIQKLKEIDESFPEYDQDLLDHILMDGFMVTEHGDAVVISWPNAGTVTNMEKITSN